MAKSEGPSIWLGIRKRLRLFCEQRWREEVCEQRSLDLFSEVKRKLVLEDYLKCVRGRRGVSAWFGFRSRGILFCFQVLPEL